MHHCVTAIASSGESGWEIAAAVGTLLGAAATAAAFVVALVVGAKDRRAASASLEKQLSAERANRQREHHIDLLVALAEQLSLSIAYQSAPQGAAAGTQARTLAFALPDVDSLPALNRRFQIDQDWSVAYDAKYGRRPRSDNELEENMMLEVTEEIRRLVGDADD